MADVTAPGLPPQAPPATRVEAPRTEGRGTGLLVAGWLFATLGALLAVAGIALVVVHLTQRDSDGYFTTDSETVAASGYAITAEGLHIDDVPDAVSDIVGRVRVEATSTNGKPLFVGIASQQAVDGYLGGVAREEVTDIDGSDITYRTHRGDAPAGRPAQQGFWRSAESGTGAVSAGSETENGDWAIVVMNASGTADVSASASLGAKTTLLWWGGLLLLALGVGAGVAGGAMLMRRRSRAAGQ